MNFYMIYATETHGEARRLGKEIERRVGAGAVRIARPEAGVLEKPYRYMVLTTSPTLAKSRDLLHEVRAAVKPPRFPAFAKIGDRLFDTLLTVLHAIGGLRHE